ncbi:hypothetical protein QYE76_017006 [Lolium multiflorum]|uniref:Transposase (putative) gypsy type domain-containing protein n=1 Tax=Lolium multiflorum TaxID=4521 RepID=A0AAD8QKJ3_LOLMU|nr:hypothetical protein QYE76_017006 [Lolium multiflorum]
MPRAPPTPNTENLNFDGFAENLPVITATSAPQTLMLQTQPIPTHFGHHILSVHIQNYVKYQVNTAGTNFPKWRKTLRLLLTMYKVMDHVTEGSAPADPDDDWRAVDIHLSMWFMATLTEDLYRLVQGTDGLACTTWNRLHRFFLSDQTSRYLYLNKAFRSTPRGDLTIDMYASKLQVVADDLAAIGRPVDERDLTVQFLNGLGERYKLQAEIMKLDPRSFADACSRLQLAEIDSATASLPLALRPSSSTAATVAKTAAAARLLTPGAGSLGGTLATPTLSVLVPITAARTRFPASCMGAARTTAAAAAVAVVVGADVATQGTSYQQPWYGYFAPMGTSFPPARWIPPNAGGVLGPRPGLHSQAYPVMYSGDVQNCTTVPALPYGAPSYAESPTPQHGAPPHAAPPHSFDYNAMVHAAMSNSPYQPPEWIMDSGASSHATENPGPTEPDALPIAIRSGILPPPTSYRPHAPATNLDPPRHPQYTAPTQTASPSTATPSPTHQSSPPGPSTLVCRARDSVPPNSHTPPHPARPTAPAPGPLPSLPPPATRPQPPPYVSVDPPDNLHPMVTRAKTGMRSMNLLPTAYKFPPFTPFTPTRPLFISRTAPPPSSPSAAPELTGASPESSHRRVVFFVFLSSASHRSKNSLPATSTTAEAIPMSSSTPPPSSEPIAAIPISSAPPPFIPMQLEPSKDSGKSIEGTSANPEDIAGAEQMEKKAEEAAKKSKARKRDDKAKGKWWPCFTTEIELRNLEAEGFIKPGSWRRVSGELNPAPEAGEWVVTKALIERGFSLPPSDFFSEILKSYELQPHHIAPNSILAISNHVALCEGHLRIALDLPLFQYFFSVKKEKVSQTSTLATCGGITFKLRPGRTYPHTDRNESVVLVRQLLLPEGCVGSGILKSAARLQGRPPH